VIPGGAGKFKAGEGTPFQAAATALTGDCTATFEFPISLKNNDNAYLLGSASTIIAEK
jgi:hypothetical protein